MGVQKILFNKPIYCGWAILELSKLYMQEFYYNVMKKKYGENVKMIYTDTDSFIFEIKTDDIYDDIFEMKDLFDLSNFSECHKLFDTTNQKVEGKYKRETKEHLISEVIVLAPKSYSYKTIDLYSKKIKEFKKSKGVKSCKHAELLFEHYMSALNGDTEKELIQKTTFNAIRSKEHKVITLTSTKTSLTAFDNKREICADRIHSYAWGFKGKKRLYQRTTLIEKFIDNHIKKINI